MQTGAQQNRSKHTLRALRPMLWWLGLVLFLFLVHTHQRLSAQTNLTFHVTFQRLPIYSGAVAQLDGRPISSGDHVAIGRHMLAISCPKAEPFSTNLFIWYGRHDLGEIALAREVGTLSIEAVPPAHVIKIQGPEFNQTFTDSRGVVKAVPTGSYDVEVDYEHWQTVKQVTVEHGMTNLCRIEPHMGDLKLACNKTDAEFRLLTPANRIVEFGRLPSLVQALPEGTYALVVNRGNERQEANVTVRSGVTNEVHIDFAYGTAVLETEPPGARVVRQDGENLGTTPLTVLELKPGLWQFTLEHEGYVPVLTSLWIEPNQTNVFRTNMVSQAFVAAVQKGNWALEQPNYDDAITAFTEALRLAPADPIAEKLLRQANVGHFLQMARSEAASNNPNLALEYVRKALAIEPEHEIAKQLEARYKRAYEEQIRKGQ